MKQFLVSALIIVVVIGMGASYVFIGIDAKQQKEQYEQDRALENSPTTSSSTSEQMFSGPPAGTPQVSGPTSAPGAE